MTNQIGTTLWCVPHFLPEASSKIEPQLPTPVICILMQTCWSHFYSSLTVVSGVTPQINYLPSNLVWRPASGELKTKTPFNKRKWWGHISKISKKGAEKETQRYRPLVWYYLKSSGARVVVPVWSWREKQAADGEVQPSWEGLFVKWMPRHHS